jgi:hypothetical protein
MKFKLTYFLFLFVLLVSCKDDNQKRDADEKDAKRKSFFEYQRMGFMTRLLMKPEATVTTWTELRLFIAELKKPKPLVLPAKVDCYF